MEDNALLSLRIVEQYDYDRFTVSKLVVVIAVVAPQYLEEYGKYALLKVGSKCLRALTSAAFGW